MKCLVILAFCAAFPIRAVATVYPGAHPPRALPPAADNTSPVVFIIPPVEKASIVNEKILPFKAYFKKLIFRTIILRIAQNNQEPIHGIDTPPMHFDTRQQGIQQYENR